METVAVYLVVTFLAGFAAVLIRLPPLVGFLVAGFVLHFLDGVYGIGQPPFLQALADLGVTLLLFGIGLKLDVRTLIRREVWLTNGSHMAISTALGMSFLLLLKLFGFGLLAGAPWETYTLIGFALSFSSTVVVVKLLDDRSDTSTTYGRLAVGVLVMQDLAAVLFLTISKGQSPSAFALGLVLLLPLTWLLRKAWKVSGHDELHLLFGVLVAFVPGYVLFELVGLKGDLGALIMGALLASHSRAQELSRELLNLKDLLLVAFFVSIGLNGIPGPEEFLLSALLLLLLPVQTLLYVGLLWWMGLRHRTSILTSLAMFSYSEFGLIVITTGSAAGWISGDWLVVMAVTVAASFVASAAVNQRALEYGDAWSARLPPQSPERLHPEDRPIDIGGSQVVVLGMGRVGRAAFERFRDHYSMDVIGIEHDTRRVEALHREGLDVLEADATDTEFWKRVSRAGEVRVVVLAMPFHSSNIDALERIRATGFSGKVAAVAQYDDDLQELKRNGTHAVFHLYGGAGTALADSVAEALGR